MGSSITSLGSLSEGQRSSARTSPVHFTPGHDETHSIGKCIINPVLEIVVTTKIYTILCKTRFSSDHQSYVTTSLVSS
jgi:hypothetical protein